MGLFDKKFCDICGAKIGLFGNRKLEDGNCCKECSAKLSPFFSERRHSTVAEIKEQLEYREANKEKVAAFHTTKTIGSSTCIYFDEDAMRFMVSSARNLADANPDVLEYSDVTSCAFDTDENKTEIKREGKDGTKISYNPPRYEISYDYYITLKVNHPYFDEIRFRLNPCSVDATNRGECTKFIQMGGEIKRIFLLAQMKQKKEAAAASAPKKVVECPFCGAMTTPDASGCCEYCGGPVGK